MPYTNDPENSANDAVRLLLGDTQTPQKLSDEEVAFLLVEEGNNVLRAAARGAETLSARFADLPSERRVGPLMIMYGTRAITVSAQYAAVAKMLWARATRMSSGGPYAGGISRDDKVARIEDTDRVKPAFFRRMMRYPIADPDSVTPDEILSPPAEVP